MPAQVVDERAGADPLVRVSGLAKTFGVTRALRACSFELRAGEVHVLAGENGSGKSTLVKILSGVHAPDAGAIEVGGHQVGAFRTPRVAQQMGVATVFQEDLSVGPRSVADNVWLGQDSMLRFQVSKAERRRRAQEVFARLLGSPLDLDTPVEELSLSVRQACAIARALLRRPSVLILDEATSALDVETRDRLFEIARDLRRDGVGTILITHRMDEIEQLGDRVTVMRSGETIATLDRGAWTSRELVRLMSGSDQVADAVGDAAHRERPRVDLRSRPVLMETRGLRLRRDRAPVNIQVHEGELLGVAGLEGHGQDAFVRALAGIGTADGTVMRFTDGGEKEIRSAQAAGSHGIAYVPRERRQDSLFPWMSILENFGLPTLSRDTSLGLFRTSATRKRLAGYTEKLSIRLGDPGDQITTLSGGNQQKVVIARWLAAGPRILILNDPTRGVDINAKHDLHALLRLLAEDGVAVVLLSTEVYEHIVLTDRVLVFRNFELFRELQRGEISRDSLVAAFFGEHHEGE